MVQASSAVDGALLLLPSSVPAHVVAAVNGKRCEIDAEIARRKEEFHEFVRQKQREMQAFEQALYARHLPQTKGFTPSPKQPPSTPQGPQRPSSFASCKSSDSASSNGFSKRTKKVQFQLDDAVEPVPPMDVESGGLEEGRGGKDDAVEPAQPATSEEHHTPPESPTGARFNAGSALPPPSPPTQSPQSDDEEGDEVFDMDETMPPEGVPQSDTDAPATRFRRRSITKYDLPEEDLPAPLSREISEDSILSNSFSSSLPIDITFFRPSPAPTSSHSASVIESSSEEKEAKPNLDFDPDRMSMSQRMIWERRRKSR